MLHAVTRHTRIYVQLNLISSVFAFTAEQKPSKSRTDPRRDVKSSERNRHLNDHNLKEEYSVFEEANTLYCQRVYIDAEVQTDIMASDFLMPV